MSSKILTELRKTFWPIESHENKKFLPMAAMMFFILFNYSMLRSIKDGFVVTDIGAEALSFLKLYVVLPFAIIAMILYSKLCNVLSQQKVFYSVCSFFVVYLSFFTFIIYPNPEFAHPDKATIAMWVESMPYLKWFLRIIGHWGISTFYCMSELWGSMMMSLLFWQFANQITKTEEAKRFYSMFGLLGNFALPTTGAILGYFLANESARYFEHTFTPVLLIAIINGIIVMLIYAHINKNVIHDVDETSGSNKKKKVKLSLKDSFKMILSSRYLGLLAILVIAYGISVSLVEGVWKSKIKELYTSKETYTAYMGQFQGWMGFGTIFFMIIGSNILRRVSWKTSAILTPLMIFITGAIFFSMIMLGDVAYDYLIGFFAVSPLVVAVTVGTIQNVLSKATKYSLFDSTKEMAYIPLDDEMKTKGKAAVDVVGGRLGKSGGGFITSTFFILMPDSGFVEGTPYFAAIFFIIVVLWLVAVQGLSKEYQNKLVESECSY